MSVSSGMRPVHPGEMLREGLDEAGLSANALVKALNVPTNRITAILRGSARGDAPDDERILGLMPNQITLRIGAVAEHAGLGPGYSGESPRLGMLKDLKDLGAVLLGERIEGETPDAG